MPGSVELWLERGLNRWLMSMPDKRTSRTPPREDIGLSDRNDS
jgi:hypothetical protein